MRFFDTHAHLDSDQFHPDRDAVLARARAAGLVGICVVGCTPQSSLDCCELAAQQPDWLCAAVGVQPNYVASAAADWMDRIRHLSQRPEVVAIGETGIDCYWRDSPLEAQQQYFQWHLDLAQETGKPFIVHMRDSGEEIRRILQPRADRGPLRGIMHSFTGDLKLADMFLSMGLHISFAGMVTYKKSTELLEVAARIPADRILIETDAPYLSPEPHRGRRPNEPARVVHTARCIAQARGVTIEEFADLTSKNAENLFRR